MTNDVRKVIYTTLVLFLLVVVGWVGTLLVFSCGLNADCTKAQPKVDRTSIPTLIPAAHAEEGMGEESTDEFNKCQVNAADLVGAWVSAGSPADEAFPFSDVNGQACEGTFSADIQRLLSENSLWFEGSLGCVSCHNAALTERSAGLDLSSHESILLGSGRAEGSTAQGNDILGGGVWTASTLHEVLVNQGFQMTGHPAEANPPVHSADLPPAQLVIYAGQAVASEESASATP